MKACFHFLLGIFLLLTNSLVWSQSFDEKSSPESEPRPKEQELLGNEQERMIELRRGINQLYRNLIDPLYNEDRATILLQRLEELGFEDFLIFQIVKGEASVVQELMRNGHIDAAKIRGVERLNLIFYSALTYHESLVEIFIDNRPIEEGSLRALSRIRVDAEIYPHWDTDTMLSYIDEKFRHGWGVIRLKKPKKYKETHSPFFGDPDFGTHDAKYGGNMVVIYAKLLKAGALPPEGIGTISPQFLMAYMGTSFPNKEPLGRDFFLSHLSWFVMGHDQLLDFEDQVEVQKIFNDREAEPLKEIYMGKQEGPLTHEENRLWGEYFTHKHLVEFRIKLDILGKYAEALLSLPHFVERIIKEYARSRGQLYEKYFDDVIKLLKHAFGFEIAPEVLQEAIELHQEELAIRAQRERLKYLALVEAVNLARGHYLEWQRLQKKVRDGEFDMEMLIKHARELGLGYDINQQGEIIELKLLPLENSSQTAAENHLKRELKTEVTGEDLPEERAKRRWRRYRR